MTADEWKDRMLKKAAVETAVSLSRQDSIYNAKEEANEELVFLAKELFDRVEITNPEELVLLGVCGHVVFSRMLAEIMLRAMEEGKACDCNKCKGEEDNDGE